MSDGDSTAVATTSPVGVEAETGETEEEEVATVWDEEGCWDGWIG